MLTYLVFNVMARNFIYNYHVNIIYLIIIIINTIQLPITKDVCFFLFASLFKTNSIQTYGRYNWDS